MAKDDDEGTRLDRELNELLQELRVIIPGIQVLFAFLLTMPFSVGFRDVTDFQRSIYFAAFVATALASVLLIAPSVQHRLRWRQHDKEHLLRTANRLALGGTILVAVAIDAVVLVVTDFLYGATTAAVATASVGAALLVVWWVSPLARAVRASPGRS